MPDKKTEKRMNQKSGTQSPTLSLCMIVKDEEHFLPMCLDSVKDHVDEIIIVDTIIASDSGENETGDYDLSLSL